MRYPLVPDNSHEPTSPPADIGDHQLGQRIGALIAQQAASNLPFSIIFSQLQDLLGDDTTLLGPLRDLLGRPGFRQLTGLEQHSVLIGSRDALLQELGQTYNLQMVGRLAAVIDGCLGLPGGPMPSAAGSGSWGAHRSGSSLAAQGAPWAAPSPEPPFAAPQAAASAGPPQASAQPTQSPPVANTGPSAVTALLIALVSMLSGAVLLGLGLLFVASRRPIITGPAAPPTAKGSSIEPQPAAASALAPAAPDTPKAPTVAAAAPSSAWGSATDYKFGQLPGGEYPNSCAFSQTDPNGRTTSDKSQLEFWACRDVGGDAENGYKVVWADGKETTYTFRADGDGMVVGTNGTTYPMSWRNDSHQGDPIIVINHQDGAISWIPGNIN